MKGKKRAIRRIIAAVAAVALLAALSVTAVAFNVFGLQDVLLDKKQPVGTVDEGGVHHPEEIQDVDMVSLAGYSDARETRALNEWTDYLNTLDLMSVAKASDDYFRTHGEWPVKDMEKYDPYTVYDQEMADTLEALLAKYDLALVGQMHEILSQDELNARLGGQLLQEGSAHWGYMYDCGALSFEGSTSSQGWEEAVDFQLRRTVKGYFDGLALNIGYADAYTQWNYVTSSGETVLLCLSPIKGLIFADFDDCFVTVNVLSGTGDDYLGRGLTIDQADMEALADDIDFSLLHPVVPYAHTKGADPEEGAGQVAQGH